MPYSTPEEEQSKDKKYKILSVHNDLCYRSRKL